MVNRLTKLNQDGAVSMISMVIFSIIITIVCTAYLRSVISQQKNALNYDLGTRAYYAAETGIQDTVRALNEDITRRTEKDDCQPFAGQGVIGGNAAYGLSFTCQLVSPTTDRLQGEVDESGSATYKIEPLNPISGARDYNLSLYWSGNTADNEEVLYPRGTYSKSFPPKTGWFRGGNTNFPIHAMLKATLIDYQVGFVSRDTINENVVFLNPTREQTPGGAQHQDPITFNYSTPGTQNAGEDIVNNAGCYPSNRSGFDATEIAEYDGDNEQAVFSDYSCKRTIRLNNLNLSSSGQGLYLRLNSIYKNTDFQIELSQVNQPPLQLANAQLTIDVTGKASNVFRRVRQTFSIENGVARGLLPDAALIAGDGICKQFIVTNDPAVFNWQCDPTNPGPTGY